MTCSPKVWGDATRLLRDEIPDFAYEAWIAPLSVKLSDARLLLGCPTAFHRERVRVHFHDVIARCWQQAWSVRCAASSAPGATDAMPALAIVDIKELAASPGQLVELPAATRRVEPAVLASGAMADAQRVEPIALAAAGSAADAAALARSGGGVAEPVRPPTATAAAAARGAQPALRDRHVVANATDRGAARARTAPAAAEPDDATTTGSPVPLRVVPPRAIRPPRAETPARDVMRVETRPSLELDGEPAQGELPFSFESFVVGPCNALAREAALALARRRQSGLNQLYLSGESGMGKTHLARAAAAEARRHGFGSMGLGERSRTGLAARPPAARAGGTRPGIVYTTAEQFTSEFVSAMRSGRAEAFQKRYRGPIGLLVVEDVQFFDGRMKTQLELFHTVQHVLDAGGHVLMTGDRAPRELKGLSERMRTQLARGFVAELERPDAIVRRHILRAKAAAGGFHLPPDCLDLLVESTGGSVRDIESVLIQVVTTASLLGRPIDLALTRDAIDRKSGVSTPLAPRRVETSEIVRIVAAFFGKRPEALAARSRRRDVLVPRQLAMYLAHRYTDASFAEIGRSLGRDHPSVRNAIERVERLVLENAPLRYQVEALSERVDQTLANRRPTHPPKEER